jgi:hypothetical protein
MDAWEGRDHTVMGWLGLAVAVVALAAWGQGTIVRLTLQAAILYVLLTNMQRLAPAINRFVDSLRLNPTGGIAP